MAPRRVWKPPGPLPQTLPRASVHLAVPELYPFIITSNLVSTKFSWVLWVILAIIKLQQGFVETFYLEPIRGLLSWLSGKESTCKCRRHRFDPWSGRIPHASEQLSLRATTTEPVLESPEIKTTEPTSCNYWSPCNLEPVLHSSEKLLQWKAQALPRRVAPTPEKSLHAAKKTQHSQSLKKKEPIRSTGVKGKNKIWLHVESVSFTLTFPYVACVH